MNEKKERLTEFCNTMHMVSIDAHFKTEIPIDSNIKPNSNKMLWINSKKNEIDYIYVFNYINWIGFKWFFSQSSNEITLTLTAIKTFIYKQKYISLHQYCLFDIIINRKWSNM